MGFLPGGTSTGHLYLILEEPEFDATFPARYLRAQSTDCPALNAGCHS